VNQEGEVEVRNASSIDERFCRGDWGAPKSDASHATIGINECRQDSHGSSWQRNPAI